MGLRPARRRLRRFRLRGLRRSPRPGRRRRRRSAAVDPVGVVSDVGAVGDRRQRGETEGVVARGPAGLRPFRRRRRRLGRAQGPLHQRAEPGAGPQAETGEAASLCGPDVREAARPAGRLAGADSGGRLGAVHGLGEGVRRGRFGAERVVRSRHRSGRRRAPGRTQEARRRRQRRDGQDVREGDGEHCERQGRGLRAGAHHAGPRETIRRRAESAPRRLGSRRRRARRRQDLGQFRAGAPPCNGGGPDDVLDAGRGDADALQVAVSGAGLPPGLVPVPQALQSLSGRARSRGTRQVPELGGRAPGEGGSQGEAARSLRQVERKKRQAVRRRRARRLRRRRKRRVRRRLHAPPRLRAGAADRQTLGEGNRRYLSRDPKGHEQQRKIGSLARSRARSPARLCHLHRRRRLRRVSPSRPASGAARQARHCLLGLVVSIRRQHALPNRRVLRRRRQPADALTRTTDGRPRGPARPRHAGQPRLSGHGLAAHPAFDGRHRAGDPRPGPPVRDDGFALRVVGGSVGR
mmetsp:Transcript_13859/g.41918  ORF Transcript_13859/g.41918 Transcript_13859/m.41918 type:complete len:521 (+) Transcript_13859:1272-2834(+)